jgi:fimbrial chaperone protein
MKLFHSRTVGSRLCAAALVLLSVATATPVVAGVFSVVPVRIYMTPRDRAVAVTITNEGDTELALQAEINEWKQASDGTDQQTPSEDLILSPPILKLAPKARQVVRLARIGAPDMSRQLTYRMLVREVPEATAPKDKTIQVPIALAMSMPVFITPPAAKREMACSAARTGQASLEVACANTGTAYAQLREILLRRGDQIVARIEGGIYILPGAKKTISLAASRVFAAGPAELAATFDDGKTQVFAVELP